MTCRTTLAILMAHSAPETLLRRMTASRRMGRGGSADHRIVIGYGVEGRGATWAEACHQWAAGARHLEDHPTAPQAVGLALWEQAA
jgi:hypothetical protein